MQSSKVGSIILQQERNECENLDQFEGSTTNTEPENIESHGFNLKPKEYQFLFRIISHEHLQNYQFLFSKSLDVLKLLEESLPSVNVHEDCAVDAKEIILRFPERKLSFRADNSCH